jgi:hypothetical protein
MSFIERFLELANPSGLVMNTPDRWGPLNGVTDA